MSERGGEGVGTGVDGIGGKCPKVSQKLSQGKRPKMRPKPMSVGGLVVDVLGERSNINTNGEWDSFAPRSWSTSASRSECY
jgi:hypothetical protein